VHTVPAAGRAPEIK